jgi:iron complex outermembrane receptor protein
MDLRYTGLRGTRAALAGIASKYVFNYPVHSGIASWNAVFPKGILARTRIGALERLARDPYAVWDLYVARSGRWQPFVQFTNLTNTGYEEIPGVIMPGRAVVAGFEIAIH